MKIKKISDVLWEIPMSFQPNMRVPARIYATHEMLEDMMTDKSLIQLANVACLPGIEKFALGMPDTHEGYGFPVGGVAAFNLEEGIISPGGIGYDINCGVRLMVSELDFSDVEAQISVLADEIYKEVPSGVGKGGSLKLNGADMDAVLKKGAKKIVEMGYGESADLSAIESGGCLEEADPRTVSLQAKKRGNDQCGTMGAGNHFVEVDRVEEIFDSKVADEFGLRKEQIVVLIHTGSRGLGHQVATDYIRKMIGAMRKYGISVPDRELACAPYKSAEGAEYLAAMSCAANFAWANREMIGFHVREAWKNVFGASGGALRLLYDVAHNIAKLEEHEIDGKKKRVIVHRKGATRSFPGQAVLIPGSMGTSSYVLVGTAGAMRQSFGSTCHGAGRIMSRTQAKKEFSGDKLRRNLEEMGVVVKTGSVRGLIEEAPEAYKDVEEVVDTVEESDLARKVARLKPIIVCKG